MGKAALEPINAVHVKRMALVLPFQEVDHLVKFRPVAFGRAFDDPKYLGNGQALAFGILLQIGKL